MCKYTIPDLYCTDFDKHHEHLLVADLYPDKGCWRHALAKCVKQSANAWEARISMSLCSDSVVHHTGGRHEGLCIRCTQLITPLHGKTYDEYLQGLGGKRGHLRARAFVRETVLKKLLKRKTEELEEAEEKLEESKKSHAQLEAQLEHILGQDEGVRGQGNTQQM